MPVIVGAIAPPATIEGPPPAPPGAQALRVLGFVVALVMAFGAIVMAITMDDLAGTPTCAAVRSGAAKVPSDRKCFDGSGARKSAVLALGIAGAAAAAAAAILALVYGGSGRRGRLLAIAVAVALALSGLSILVGAI